MQHETPSFRESSRREALFTLTTTALTLLAIIVGGYYAPSLLAAALH